MRAKRFMRRRTNAINGSFSTSPITSSEQQVIQTETPNRIQHQIKSQEQPTAKTLPIVQSNDTYADFSQELTDVKRSNLDVEVRVSTTPNTHIYEV